MNFSENAANLDDVDLNQGLEEIISYAFRKGKYCSILGLFKKQTILRQNPFDSGKSDITYLMGEIGITASIAPFINVMCLEIKEVTRLGLYQFPLNNAERHKYDITAFFQTDYETYLCHGLTNYSREGSGGLGIAERVLMTVSWVKKVPFTLLTCSDVVDTYSLLQDSILHVITSEGMFPEVEV